MNAILKRPAITGQRYAGFTAISRRLGAYPPARGCLYDTPGTETSTRLTLSRGVIHLVHLPSAATCRIVLDRLVLPRSNRPINADLNPGLYIQCIDSL